MRLATKLRTSSRKSSRRWRPGSRQKGLDRRVDQEMIKPRLAGEFQIASIRANHEFAAIDCSCFFRPFIVFFHLEDRFSISPFVLESTATFAAPVEYTD